MTNADKLISEAVFYEINMQRWHKGLFDSLKPHIGAIENRFIDVIAYSNKYPNSPDARNLVKALGNILDSVSENYKSLEILRGAK